MVAGAYGHAYAEYARPVASGRAADDSVVP
jgi:hypothetical protein